MKVRFSISKKLSLAFSIIIIAVIMSSVLTYRELERNKKVIGDIANVHTTSVNYLQEMYNMITNSKLLIRNWVFVERKTNTPGKVKLKNIHTLNFPIIKEKIKKISIKWSSTDQRKYNSLTRRIEKELFEKHKYIMAKLNSFDSYDRPMIIFESEMMVENEEAEIMALSNEILHNLDDLIRSQNKIVANSKEKMDASFIYFRRIVFWGAIGLVLSTILIAGITTQLIVRPVLKLNKASEQIAQGNLDTKVQIGSKDEIQELAETFNQMAVSLKNNQEKLSEANQILEDKTLKLEQANKALFESEQRFKDLNLTKDKFFSIIAHDLKNPFSTLISASDMLHANFSLFDDKRKKEYILMINNASRQGYNLLENLLEWSRSQTGRIKFAPINLPLAKVIDENLLLLNNKANTKSIELKAEINGHDTVFADYNMTTTVIRNLISNALKFTQRGGTVWIRNHKEGKFQIIEVEDNGIGIPDDIRENLFKIDENTSTSGTDNERGTGLGLILCNEFAEKNGGAIHVESELKKGSRFRLVLPAGRIIESENMQSSITFHYEKELLEFLEDYGIDENLISTIKTDLYPKYQFIKENLSIDKIKEFAERIIEVGDKHQIYTITEYGVDVLEYINLYEFANLLNLLSEVPLLFNILIAEKS